MMRRRTFTLSIMTVAVLVVASSPLFATCPGGLVQPSQHSFGGYFTNCRDLNPVTGFIYVVDAAGSACPNTGACNSASVDTVCENSADPNAQGGVCQFEAGSNGDGNVTVSFDWGGLGTFPGCPNASGIPGVGRNVVQVIGNKGESIMATVGYSLELASYAIDCAHPPDPSGLAAPLSCSFTDSVRVTTADATTVCTNQPVPHIFSDCDAGTLCGPGNALGITPTCDTPSANPTANRGRLYQKNAPCGTSPDPVLSTGWTLLPATPDATGAACNQVPRPASPNCAFVGATGVVNGTETLAVLGSLQVGGQNAPSARAIEVRASVAGSDVVIKWRTTSELDLAGFNILAAKKDKDRTTVSSGMIAGKGANGAGASYEVRIPRSKFQGSKTVFVETVLSSGGRIVSDPATF
jgi:hypothetical protein